MLSTAGGGWFRYCAINGDDSPSPKGMGTIIRCPSCDNVLIRVVQAKGRYWLDMRGVRVLQISTEG